MFALAVVPQQAYPIFKAIKEVEKWAEKAAETTEEEVITKDA